MADIASTGCFRQLYYASLGNYRKILISEIPLFPYPGQLPVIGTDKEKLFSGGMKGGVAALFFGNVADESGDFLQKSFS